MRGAHHLAHLAELLEQVVHFFQRGAGAAGDAFAAGAAYDFRATSLVLGHAEHDRLGALHFFAIKGVRGQLFFDFAKTGEQTKQAFERTHVLDHFHLIEEIGEVELALGHALGAAHGIGLVDLIGHLLNHADDVAHAENAVRHAGGVKFTELIEFFPFADVFDRLASDGAHGEGGTATGIAIELGEDDAGEADGVIEVGGHGNGLLAGGGVGDEKGFFRCEKGVQFFELGDEVVVELLATSGVEDDDAVVLGLCPSQRVLGDFDEVGLGGGRGVAGDFRLFCQKCELFDGGGAVEVDRDQHGAATFFFQAIGEFRRGGGFTSAIQSAKQDARGRIEVERGIVATEEGGEFIVENLDDLLAGFDRFEHIQAQGFFLDAVDKITGNGKFHVGLEQGEPDFAQSIADVRFGNFPDAAQVAEGFVEGVGE